MEEQQLDGIVLAAAGLKRLGMEDVITQYLAPEDMIQHQRRVLWLWK
mgnify:CR=1 FL=1